MKGRMMKRQEVIVLSGALLLLVGWALLPWVLNMTGAKLMIESFKNGGWIALLYAGGLVGGLAGVLGLLKSAASGFAGLLALPSLIYLTNTLSSSQSNAAAQMLNVSIVGVGVWVSAAGVGVMVIGGLMLLVDERGTSQA